MRDDEVREMRRLLNRPQRLDRALEAAGQIHERAHDQELCREIAPEGVPPATHRTEKIDQHRPHRNDQKHGGDDGKRLGPVGDRTVKIVMDADERIEEGKRPETNQGELMSIERIAHADRKEVVDQRIARRRDPEADDVMDVEAMECRTVYPGNRVGQNEASQHQIHRRPYEGGDQIPERDVELRFEALCDGHDELRSRSGYYDEHGNFSEERELARFKTVVRPERQRYEAGQESDAPHPGEWDSPLTPGHSNAAQARDQIIAFANEQRRKRAENDAIDVDRTEPAKGQPQGRTQIIGIVEETRQCHADRRRDNEPEHPQVKPSSDD